jgi:hypothetical protein
MKGANGSTQLGQYLELIGRSDMGLNVAPGSAGQIGNDQIRPIDPVAQDALG